MRHSLPAPMLSASSDVIAERFGLHFPPERWLDLERALANAAGELKGVTTENLAARIVGGQLTPVEAEVLTDKLTVGETYFFREIETLRLFEQRILPEILKAHAVDRRLRIWSAACCTGEEPFTIAMILDRHLPDIESWDITILATDVNPSFLRRAREGRYRQWSLRATTEATRDRYFRRRRNDTWELDRRIRAMVSFSSLNLASDDYPSLLNGTTALDVIFCRNVLMYFDAARASAVVGKLHRALAPGGWLVVGAVEMAHSALTPFAALRAPEGTLHRKTALPASGRERVLPPQVSSTPFAASNAPPAVGSPQLPAEKATLQPLRVAQPDERLPRETPTVEDLLSVARRRAGEHRLEEAEDCCRRAIERNRTNPAAHYLLSAIQRELGKSDAAVRSLNRTLYLDPDFVVAHFALANIELSRSHPRHAERHLSNTLAALRSYSASELVPESDGLTAGWFADRVAAMLSALRRRMSTATEDAG